MAKQVDSTNIGTLLEALITKIKSFFWRKDETSQLPIDNTPTSGSNNLVKSGGVYSALAEKYTKPSGGIPASDLANGVIPDVSQFITKSVNDLTNYYLKSETYTKDEVASLIGAIQQFHYEIAASTSAVTDPSNNVLYLIGPTGSGADKYEEYVYDATKPVAERWVKIGDTSIDLSGYVTTQALNTALAAYTTTNDLATLLAGKQDTIDANHKLAYSLLSGTPPEIFPVTYGTTTQSQIATAIAAGKLPVCKYGDNVYVYAGESSAGYSQFTSVLYDTAYRIYVKDSTWGGGSYEIYSKPNGGIPASDLADGVIPTVPTQYAGSPTAGGFANKAVAIPFGEVVEGSTETDLLATVDNFPDTLTDGVCAYVRNNMVSSASGFTLNINGTGAKPVYQTLADAGRVTTVFNAASTYLFIYNSTRVEGGCWDLYYGYNSNDNTIGYNLRTNTMSLPTTSACYRYRLLFTSADGTYFVPANSSSSTSATAKKSTTSTKIDPFGSIRYYSSTSAVSSGSRPGATALWEQYLVTLGYSFNTTGAALTLTPWKPVYIKCTPQTDGSAIIMQGEAPYVQDLPTTADEKIYIYLGVATSATQVEMTLYHPVYYHDGIDVRIWTGKQQAFVLYHNSDTNDGVTRETFSWAEVQKALTQTEFDIYLKYFQEAHVTLAQIMLGNGSRLYSFVSLGEGGLTLNPFYVSIDSQTSEPVSLTYGDALYTYDSATQTFVYEHAASS